MSDTPRPRTECGELWNWSRGNERGAGGPLCDCEANGGLWSDELAFHIVDSSCYRSFCRIGIAHKGLKKSALCDNIKALSAPTWEAINRILVVYAEDKKIEKGREVRIDSTVVSSNIHSP